MKLPNLKGLSGVIKTFVMANRPEILLATAVVGVVGTGVTAAMGGYKARGIVDDERAKRVASPEPPFDTYLEYKEEYMKGAPDLPLKDKVSLTWLCYMPAAISATTAIGSIGGLHLVHVKDKKAMATAALAAIEEVKIEAKAYHDEVLQVVEENSTEKGKEKIHAALEERGIATAPMISGDSLYLVMDAKTGRSFFSTETKIQGAATEVNQMLQGRDVELNSFYVWAGCPEVDDGDEEGWNTKEFLTLKWDDVHLPDGRPARKFTFQPAPKRGFDTRH